MSFWQNFERAFGPPSERPESYWAPALGHWCHVGPGDLAALTPAQLLACWQFIPKDKG